MDNIVVEEEKSTVITEMDVILDEIEAANNMGELDSCAEKIKENKDFIKEEKNTLREAYKEKKKIISKYSEGEA